MAYPKIPYVGGKRTALLQCERQSEAIVRIRPELPGNAIVIHGANDVGTSFAAVDKGLVPGTRCAHVACMAAATCSRQPPAACRRRPTRRG